MSRRGSILIVDDNDDLRESLKELLELEGYSVVAAQNGWRALDVLRSRSDIALVLLDMMMPGMSGDQVVDEMRKDPERPIAQVPIVLLTAAGTVAERLAERVDGCMRKPLVIEALLELVAKYCGG